MQKDTLAHFLRKQQCKQPEIHTTLGEKANANFPLNAWRELPEAMSLGLLKSAFKTSQKHL